MKKIIILLVSAIALISCKENKATKCDYTKMKDFDIKICDVGIKIPDSCILKDTLIFDDKILMNYFFESADSSLLLLAYVKNFNYEGWESDISVEKQAYSQRGDIEDTILNQSHEKLLDTIFLVNKIKTGYLKYKTKQRRGEFIESKIYFFRDKKLCVIELLERYKNEEQKKHSIADCMLESLRFY